MQFVDLKSIILGCCRSRLASHFVSGMFERVELAHFTLLQCHSMNTLPIQRRGHSFLPLGDQHGVDVKILGDLMDWLDALERFVR